MAGFEIAIGIGTGIEITPQALCRVSFFDSESDIDNAGTCISGKPFP